jgi:hypothetical protein
LTTEVSGDISTEMSMVSRAAVTVAIFSSARSTGGADRFETPALKPPVVFVDRDNKIM